MRGSHSERLWTTIYEPFNKITNWFRETRAGFTCKSLNWNSTQILNRSLLKNSYFDSNHIKVSVNMKLLTVFLVLGCLFVVSHGAEDQEVKDKKSKTCYYCGIEKPCPFAFDSEKESVRTIECEKSCLKFDGYTERGKRVIIRDCGYYLATECGPGEYEDSADGTVCHCLDGDKCNGSPKAALAFPVILLVAINIFYWLWQPFIYSNWARNIYIYTCKSLVKV